MNKIRLPGVVWIASDIHLGPHTPKTRQAFFRFLEAASGEADALILCGDIFDAWIGDDLALRDPPGWLDETLIQLQNTARHMPLWLGRGNRDFLLGTGLSNYLGAHLLPEISCLQTDHGEILLSHGDEYCTDDTAYQRFRGIVRNPLVQGLFLSLNIGLRRGIADWARNRSMMANRRKPRSIMDVSPSAIEHAFTRSGLHTMVHGHTHRPGVHTMRIGTQTRTRIVLPDWHYDEHETRGGWLTIDANGLNLVQNPDPGQIPI